MTLLRYPRPYGGMADFDFVAWMRNAIAGNRRAPDGLLHCSGDLVGSLRHAQLTAAGAPTLPVGVTDSMPLLIGTAIHSWIESNMRGMPAMQEVSMTPWLPEGWAGTADLFLWDDDLRAFWLYDFKTAAPESMVYLDRDGVKEAHHWQASAYYHAAVRMGIPVVNGYRVCYIPKQRPRRGNADPVVMEGTPLPREVVEGRMESRWGDTAEYLAGICESEHMGGARTHLPDGTDLSVYLTPELHPVQERVQVRDKDGNVKLAPHWSTRYCPFPNELCDCREQGETKIGHYDESGIYVPRKGYEDVIPTV